MAKSEFDVGYVIRNKQSGGLLVRESPEGYHFTASFQMARKFGTEDLARGTMEHIVKYRGRGLPLEVCKATVNLEAV